MRRAVPLLAAVLACGSAAHAEPAPAPAPAPAPVPGDVRAAAAGVNAFTADVLRSTAASGGNSFLSPYSISVAMAMARAGARGATAAQMDAVLHLSSDAPAAYRVLVATLAQIPMATEWTGRGGIDERTTVPAYALSVANGLFSQRGWAFEESFRSTIGRDFGAEFMELDFANTAAARKAINDWVAAKTKDRIKDVVPAGLPKSDTRLALANAIHFKAQWNKPFPEYLTKDRPFTVAPGKDVTAKSMSTTQHFGYREAADARVLEIPYRDYAMSMVVILPKAKDGLDAVVTGLTPQRLEAYVAEAGFESREVALELPKFSFTSAFDASAMLKSLGIRDAFAEHADFGGIAKEPLLISAVLHKAFVAVDEKGTEAAAATVVLMAPTSAPGPAPEPTRFVVDHPFLFLLRHRRTGAVLFAGRVVDPTAR